MSRPSNRFHDKNEDDQETFEMTDTKRVPNDSFYKDILNKVQKNFQWYENELCDDDPVGSDECLELDVLSFAIYFAAV